MITCVSSEVRIYPKIPPSDAAGWNSTNVAAKKKKSDYPFTFTFTSPNLGFARTKMRKSAP